LGPAETLEVFHFYFIGDAAMDPANADLRDRVITNLISINEEDIDVVESMQRGRHSPGYVKAPFSPYQEATIHQFQRNIARKLMGVDQLIETTAP